MLYISKCLAPSNEPGDFIDFSVDFEVFEALRNARKFIHAWWGEQGVGDLARKAMPEYYEQLLEKMLMELEQGQGHFLSLWEGPKKHS